MSYKHLPFLLLLLLLGVSFTWNGAEDSSSTTAQAEDLKPVPRVPAPVDESMHHFMEYVFEPNYKRLKVSMASEPEDRAIWKAIKGDSLTLAESANLLLLRAPKEDKDMWQVFSLAVRGTGGELYQAARKSDYAAAHKAYTRMLQHCNACHKEFADGKHQLTP